MAALARVGDGHTCPKTNPNGSPHVGGPILGPGVATVLVGDAPAAVVGDQCVCLGPPDETKGQDVGVRIGDKVPVRQGDETAHGGRVVSGCGSVQVG